MIMPVMDFSRRFVFLDRGRPLSFDRREYLRAIYDAYPQNIVLRCSRQVEKSTFIANSIFNELAMIPGRVVCYVAPRHQQAQLFSKLRFGRTLLHSLLLRRRLLGDCRTRPPINDIEFRNGSMLHIRSAFQSADSARGLSIHSLYLDEYQDLAHDALPVLQEAMSHCPDPRTVIAGTPKLIENPLEAAYQRSTQNEWTIPCAACGRQNLLDLSVFGARGFECAECRQPIDVQSGRWVAKNPSAHWQGFWINHAMVPWHDYDDLLLKQAEYDDVRFRNEVLGLPTTLGDHVISLQELANCCGNWGNIRTIQELPAHLRHSLVAGIDWGGGGAASTAVCIGYLDPQSRYFVVVHFSKFRGREDPVRIIEQVAEVCQRFNVMTIAADAGNGVVNNRLLVERCQPRLKLTAIRYAASDHKPTDEGLYHTWSVDRTRSIGHLISCAKSKHIQFPRFDQSRPFLEEIACEVAEYDDQQRTLRYTHPPNTQDDCLHACNYALLQACRVFENEAVSAYAVYDDE